MTSDILDDDHSPTRNTTSSAGRAGAPAWADLLESALHPDWGTVDGDLRQFLSRLRGLEDIPDGQGAGLVWILWIGTATAVILARRSSHGPWLSFRRPAVDPVRVSPVAIPSPSAPGPWVRHDAATPGCLAGEALSGDPAARNASSWRSSRTSAWWCGAVAAAAAGQVRLDGRRAVGLGRLLYGFRDAGWRFPDEAHLRAFLVKLIAIGSSTSSGGTGRPPRARPARAIWLAGRRARLEAPPPQRAAQADELGADAVRSAPRRIARSSSSGSGTSAGRDRDPDRPARGQRAPHPLRPGAGSRSRPIARPGGRASPPDRTGPGTGVVT